MKMNRLPISIANSNALAVSACLLGLCLVAGTGCNQSHCPAITAPAQAASTAQVDQAVEENPATGDDKSPDSAHEPKPEVKQAPPAEQPAAAVATRDITFDALKFDIKAGDLFAFTWQRGRDDRKGRAQ